MACVYWRWVMQMRTVVYADILLAINWIVDYFLLLGVAVITGCGVTRWRLLLAGALGGCSAFIFLAPQLPLWAQLAYQAVTGALIVLAAFRLHRPRTFLKLAFWYFLLNLCYSGLVLAAMYWLSFTGVRRKNMAFYYDVSPLLLVVCIVALYLLLRLLLLLFEKPRSDVIVWAHVQLQQEQLDAEILVDSGFTASDALLGLPLLLLSFPDTVTEAQPQLKSALEEYFCAGAVAGSGAKPVSAAAGQNPEHTLHGMRLLPLHTAAGSVLVPAFTAQAVLNGRSVQVAAAFSKERFRAGQVQGLFGAKSYEMIGGC